MCWRFENADDLNLIETMKSIKRKYDGVRFSDVLLSALSNSFHHYFESKGAQIPETMTVVLPARIEAESEFFFLISPIPCCEQIRSIHNILFGKIGSQLKLQNKFSVGLQTIPIFGRKSTNHINRFQRKMLQIKKFSDQLRNSPDYYVIAHFFYKKILLIQHNLWQKCFFLLDVTGQLLVNDICYVFAARSYVGRVNGKCAQYDCR